MAESVEAEADPSEELPPGGAGCAVALVVVAFAVSTLLAEGLLRLAWHNPYANETTDHLIRLEVQHPLRDMELDRSALDPENPRARFRTDARSYILPSRQYEDPQATVAFLGGSTTANNAVLEELRFPARVSTVLAERGLRINTLNAGKSGISSQDSINLLFNHVVLDQPDVVVMMHAHNDIGRLTGKGEYGARSEGPSDLRTVARWALQRGSIHSSLVGALRFWQTTTTLQLQPFERKGKPAESASLPTEKYVARLKTFVGVCRAFGITPVLMTQPVINVRTPLTPDWTDPRNQEIFNHLIREVGAEEDVLVIDLVRFFFEEVDGWREPMVVFYDGVHFTDRGSDLAARYIADRLYEVALPPVLEGVKPAASR